MVYEEKFLAKYDVPALLAVGFEGAYHFLSSPSDYSLFLKKSFNFLFT